METAYVGHNMSQIAHEEGQKKFVQEVKTRVLFSLNP